MSEHDGCDCTELCSMGPTCPGGMLADLPGSGCWRTVPTAADVLAQLRATSAADERRRFEEGPWGERA